MKLNVDNYSVYDKEEIDMWINPDNITTIERGVSRNAYTVYFIGGDDYTISIDLESVKKLGAQP
jgi:hypothetical protein